MAERSRRAAGQTSTRKTSTRKTSRKPAAQSKESSADNRNGLSAAEAVARAREGLSALIGLPVEGVLGIDRDHGDWVATVQVVELARIPNTTDVLGEYETVIDRDGEIVRYHRSRRYHRGQVDGGQS